MKLVLTIIAVLIPLLLIGVTREVSLDGSQQYISIQAAINACSDGDSVLVYPGRYVENINLNGHSIILASLYARNPLQTYIDSTIVDGNLGTCMQAVNGETVTINGFTCVNNEQHVDTYFNSIGGIFANNETSLSVLNCIIRDCTAIGGGGISAGNGVSLYLSNVMIYDNKTDRSGGGLTFTGNQITFDLARPCSIYNNVSAKGMDIIFYYLNSNPTQFNIVLNMGSLALSAPDNYFIVAENANVSVSIQQGYVTQTDQDLYVSPEGSDINSGTSATAPLKTIARALQRIVSNADNPHTIHLAAGIYSFSSNAQMLPIGLKSHVKLIGAGTDNTIIDAELRRGFFSSYFNTEMELAGMTLRNVHYDYSAPLNFWYCSFVSLHNLNIVNSQGSQQSGITIYTCSDVILENIYVGEITNPADMASLYVKYSRNVFVNNFVTSNIVIISSDGNFLGPTIFDSDLTIRNSIFANNTGIDAYLFSYQTTNSDYADCNLEMSNVLFYNNSVTQCSWVFCPIYMQNRYQSMQINNCTIANNSTNSTLTQIYGYADIKNLITYNPGSPGEVYLKNRVYNDELFVWVNADVTVSNSLFRTGSVNSSLPDLVTFSDNIFSGNPLFEGMINDSLDISQPEYYQLSANSPCINSGIADTTGMNLPLMDLAGNHRVWDGRIDMGCYEYGSEPVAIVNPEYPPLPEKIKLSTYPNPVYLNGAKGAYAFIEFTLPQKSREKPVVEIYNLKGQKVRTMKLTESFGSLQRKAGLRNGELRMENGELIQDTFTVKSVYATKYTDKGNRLGACSTGEFYSTVWDCKDDRSQKLASGIYIVKVSSGKHQTTAKMTILK